MSPSSGSPSSAGYSGTPLPRKLGIKPSHSVAVIEAPRGLEATLGPLPEGATLSALRAGRSYDLILLFARDERALATKLAAAKKAMADTSALWICWPKKTSRLSTELDGNGVRKRGLDSGLVDIKVCAVDEDWSGLKFVYRVKDRVKKK